MYCNINKRVYVFLHEKCLFGCVTAIEVHESEGQQIRFSSLSEEMSADSGVRAIDTDSYSSRFTGTVLEVHSDAFIRIQ